jgi:hypothetical protein
MVRAALGLSLCVLFGCGQREAPSPTPTASPVIEPEVKHSTSDELKKLLEFQGKPADKAIDFDLVGNWNVMRFGTPERPSKGGRFDGRWHLKPFFPFSTKLKANRWSNNGTDAGHLVLKTAMPQILEWYKGDKSMLMLSINEQSFGLLMMTGSDGDGYMAVRTD